VENPQLAVGWGDFVDVEEEPDDPDEPESPDDDGDDVDDVDFVEAAGAASLLAGEAAVSEDDSLPRLSVR
jgi:hypothetical protein